MTTPTRPAIERGQAGAGPCACWATTPPIPHEGHCCLSGASTIHLIEQHDHYRDGMAALNATNAARGLEPAPTYTSDQLAAQLAEAATEAANRGWIATWHTEDTTRDHETAYLYDTDGATIAHAHVETGTHANPVRRALVEADLAAHALWQAGQS